MLMAFTVLFSIFFLFGCLILGLLNGLAIGLCFVLLVTEEKYQE